MIKNCSGLDDIAIPLPISSENRQIARNFAAQQATAQQADRVLLNTLAVLTVKNYLDLLDIATDLSNSDSWNPIMRVCNDVADLEISDLGTLECRPIKKSDTCCHIPMDVWNFRLGYVVVKIDDSLHQAQILGFTPQVTTEDLAITDLKPIEALIDRIHDLRQSTVDPTLVNLGQWLNNIFTVGWETIESLVNSEQLTPAGEFRSAELPQENISEVEINQRVPRAKLIDLGIQLQNRQIILLVEIIPEEKDDISITIQLHPEAKDIYLPESLTLKIIELSGEVFMQAQARSQDNYIQLKFNGQPQERFAVEISLNDLKIREQFQI